MIQRNPVFMAYRAEQKKLTDRTKPCILMDHPEAFRRICQVEGCRPAKNIPPGYLDGDIAKAFDAAAAEWEKAAEGLPPIYTD